MDGDSDGTLLGIEDGISLGDVEILGDSLGMELGHTEMEGFSEG